MGAERCIVLLVFVVMGTSFYVMTSVVDESVLSNYRDQAAGFNEEHNEHFLQEKRSKYSKVLRSAGQGINEDPEGIAGPNDGQGIDKQFEHARIKRSSGQGIDEQSEYARTKQSSGQGIDEQSEHARIKRSSGQGIDKEPEHARIKRSSGQGIDEQSEYARTKLSSGQGIDEQSEYARTKQSSGQGIDEQSEYARTKRSSGQGIDEQSEYARTKRSSGQGIDEQSEYARTKRSSGQGIDKQSEYARTKRSSGQGIDEQSEYARTKRSSGQGIDEQPEHARIKQPSGQGIDKQSEHARIKRSSGQGIDEQTKQARFKRSSDQGINEDPESETQGTADKEDDSRAIETASNLDSSAEDFSASIYEPTLNNEYQLLRESNNPLDLRLSGSHFGIQYEEEENEKSEQLQKLLSKNRRDIIGHFVQYPYNVYHYELSNFWNSSDDIDRLLFNFEKDRIIKLNKGVDFILGFMNTMFSNESELTVDLPDVNKTIGHGIMAGNFVATKGYFKNPATLHRTGDVYITKIGDTVSFEVALGLQTLDAGFRHYDLKILNIRQAGDVDISIAQNSIKLKISLTYAPACNVTVDYLALDELGGIKIKISGLGAFQSMFDMLSKWFIDNFTEDLKRVINQKLGEKARKAVARHDICKYFPS